MNIKEGDNGSVVIDTGEGVSITFDGDMMFAAKAQPEAVLALARLLCWDEVMQAALERLAAIGDNYSGWSFDSSDGDQRSRVEWLALIGETATDGLKEEVDRLRRQRDEARAERDRLFDGVCPRDSGDWSVRFDHWTNVMRGER